MQDCALYLNYGARLDCNGCQPNLASAAFTSLKLALPLRPSVATMGKNHCFTGHLNGMRQFNLYGDLHVQPWLLPSWEAFALRACSAHFVVKLGPEPQQRSKPHNMHQIS